MSNSIVSDKVKNLRLEIIINFCKMKQVWDTDYNTQNYLKGFINGIITTSHTDEFGGDVLDQGRINDAAGRYELVVDKIIEVIQAPDFEERNYAVNNDAKPAESAVNNDAKPAEEPEETVQEYAKELNTESDYWAYISEWKNTNQDSDGFHSFMAVYETGIVNLVLFYDASKRSMFILQAQESVPNAIAFAREYYEMSYERTVQTSNDKLCFPIPKIMSTT